MVSGSLSTIHGDLNLENILVGPGGFVWLIDFAQTRDGHTLFDFAHLGAEIIAHVIAPQVQSPDDYLELLLSDPFSTQADPTRPLAAPARPLAVLLKSLSRIAEKCLVNPAQPREFQRALCLACLGALKYQNLDFDQKHLLYLTAAYLCTRQEGQG
jgi:thiamine kinase-like enzyme